MVASKRGRKMFSSIFPKLGSSFFDLNMSLGESGDLLIKVDPTAPLAHQRPAPAPVPSLRQHRSPFKHPG